MDKEDLLERYKKENAGMDEREESQTTLGFGLGGVTVAILCVFFSILSALQGRHFYEFGVILFGYMATVAWNNFRITRKMKSLIQGLANTIAALSALLAFFLLTYLP